MIQIISAEFVDESPSFWNCWLELTQGDESYSLPATAPGEIAESELLAHFGADEASLWQTAQRKQYPGGVYQGRKDFESFAARATTEIGWLEETIPAIDTMTAAQVRDVVKRLAQENLEMIRAWRYVIRRLS